MERYIVLFLDVDADPNSDPLAFACSADDDNHAAAQCINAYPESIVVWVFEGDDASAAMSDYWGC